MSLYRRVRTALLLTHLALCGLGDCAGVLLAQDIARGLTGTDAAASSRTPSGGPATTTTAAQEGPARTERPVPTTEPKPPAATEPAPRIVGPPAVEEVRPELYYLKNKDGELEPVLGFTYEDFYRLYRLEQNLQKGAKPPAFRFDKATLSGKADGGRLALRAEFHIVATEAGWTRVPLGMTTAILAELPKQVDGVDNGERVLQFDATDGYVLWLNGAAGASHTVVLDPLLVPLEANGDETRLRLLLPRSLAAAEVRFQLPIANARIKAADVATVVATKAVGDASTEATVTARGGELQLSWRGGELKPTAEMRVVEATAAIRATIDDRAVLWDAQLTVRSIGEPLESFDVRLPAGAQLDPVSLSGVVVSVSGESPRIATVSLDKPATDPVTIRFVCRRGRNVAEAKEIVDFSGFEVVGAMRQSGAIVVAIDGDWRIAWQQRAEVRDIEQPPESLVPPDDQQAYSFAFYRQPFSLSGEITAQPARLDVEPQYQVTVEGDQLLLVARLMYKVRGAKVARVQMQLAGWELDEVGPAGLIQSAGAAVGADGLLSAPLTQRMRSTFDLTLTARRPLNAAARRVDFSLPSVVADTIAPPTLVVESADNIDLMPIEAELSQLTPRGNGTAAATMTPTTAKKRRHPPLVYRVLGDGREARFVAERTIRTREVAAESKTEVSIVADEVRVEQHIDLHVAFEALNRIVLDVPAELAARRDATYLIEGQPVLPIEIGPSPNGALTSGTAASEPANTTSADDTTGSIARVALEPPAAIEDRVRVTIRHATRFSPNDAGSVAPRMLSVPLVISADGAQRSNVVRIAASVPGTITARGPWVAGGSASSDASNTAEFRTGERVGRISLLFAARPPRTVALATWIRTVVADSMRQDRVAFRVGTNEPGLDIALPRGAREDQVAVWVDRQQVAPRFVDAQRESAGETLQLRVDIASKSSSRAGLVSTTDTNANEHTVEILYNIEAENDLFGRHRWEPPRIVGDVWDVRTHWEVIVPRNEHLVADPDGFTPEYGWQWAAALRWGDMTILPVLSRRPSLNRAELQRLTGATPIRLTDGQSNRYLFSTSGPAAVMEIRTLPRSILVLSASGLAIALGVALIYAPNARRPIVLLVVGVVLAGVAIWSPAAAILGGQAAAIGLVLSILAGACSWWMADRTPLPSPLSATAQRIERGSSASRPRRDERSQATTLTIPVEVNAGDSNP